MASRKLNVVVVDDDPSIVRLIQKLLDVDLADRVETIAMTDAQNAQQWIDQNRCDILLSDIEMPGADGLEMLRYAKARNPWTQVILITAHSTWPRIAEAIEYGAIDYVLKPIVSDDLIPLVAQECDRHDRWQAVILETLTEPTNV